VARFTGATSAGLADGIERRGIAWFHLPIPDVSIPGHEFERTWRTTLPRQLGTLGEGQLDDALIGLARADHASCYSRRANLFASALDDDRWRKIGSKRIIDTIARQR